VSVADIELEAASKSEWRLIEQREVTYSWPDGRDEHSFVHIYESANGNPGRYAIEKAESGDREYWGKRRPYLEVFRLACQGSAKQLVAVFVAADDFETSRECIAAIRGGEARHKRMFGPGDTPPGYQHMRLVVFRDRIAGTRRFNGYTTLAVVAHEDDAESMLRHAALQVALRPDVHGVPWEGTRETPDRRVFSPMQPWLTSEPISHG
jgi:hypothetical protein